MLKFKRKKRADRERYDKFASMAKTIDDEKREQLLGRDDAVRGKQEKRA